MTQAVILAGGKGTRLAAASGGLPKPLVAVAGVPVVERQIALLLRDEDADTAQPGVVGADQAIALGR